ncbi:MAG: hypothetical protein JO323_24825 [Acidobacteriia bacterium]|nr:hypothetical protein [Terriglobia bacterium]
MGHGLIERIRHAVGCGEFSRASLLWEDYARGLERKLKLDGGLSAEELREAGELVAWSRQVVQCARARAMEQLDSLQVAGQYETPPRPQTPRLVIANF